MSTSTPAIDTAAAGATASFSEAGSSISIYHHSVVPKAPGIPRFIFHLTRMVDTLFVWVGVGETEQNDPGQSIGAGVGHLSLRDDEDASERSQSKIVQVKEKKLAGDWAVAMPSRGNIPITATSIYKSGAGASGSDLALSMSQRLARRFPCNQIHLSLSLPSSLTQTSQTPTSDPYASRHLLMMEKNLVTWLGEIMASERKIADQLA